MVRIVLTDRDRTYNRIEDKAKRLNRRFESIDHEAQRLDESRREANAEWDSLIVEAAAELDDDNFYDIFGTYPDRSNVPEDAPADPPRSPYERTIVETLFLIHPSPRNLHEIDPRHIEALIRGRYPTLDGMHLDEFQNAVVAAVRDLAEIGPEIAERLAVSHGI